MNNLKISKYNNRAKAHLKYEIVGLKDKNGIRVRRAFKTKTEAKAVLDLEIIKFQNLGTKAYSISPEFQLESLRLKEKLAPYNKSLTDAVSHYINHLKATEKSAKIKELIPEFIQHKKDAKLSAVYLQELNYRLSLFKEQFAETYASEVPTQIIQKWIFSLEVGDLSKNHYRRVLSAFFTYCQKNGYCSVNPVTNVAKIKASSAPIEIFTIPEVETLLENAELDIQTYLAIGLFAGLRDSEIQRLTWENINWSKKIIDLSQHQTKTAQRRLVEISSNLFEWLEPHRNKSGLICSINFINRLKKYKITLADDEELLWKKNGARHSYASYHLAAYENADKTSRQLGHNNASIIYKHYIEIADKEEAEEYWNIVPTVD